MPVNSRFHAGARSLRYTSRSACGNGNGRRKSPSTSAKTAVLAATPSASVSTMSAVGPGWRVNDRTAKRRSARNERIVDSSFGRRPRRRQCSYGARRAMSHVGGDRRTRVARADPRSRAAASFVGEQRFDLGAVAVAHVRREEKQQSVNEAFGESSRRGERAGSRWISDAREPSLRHADERLHALDLGHQRAAALWRYAEPAAVAAVLVALAGRRRARESRTFSRSSSSEP